MPLLNVGPKVAHWALTGVVEEKKDPLDFVYLEQRPLQILWKPPIRTDCSFYAILCYWMAGGIDPTGKGFSGWGNSDDLFNNNKHITVTQVLPGDPIVFGPGGSVHAVIALTNGLNGNPVCASMGQPGDPSTVTLKTLESLGTPTFLRANMLPRKLAKLEFWKQ